MVFTTAETVVTAAHVPEVVSVCLFVSVTNLAMGSFISALKSNRTVVTLVAVVLSSL